MSTYSDDTYQRGAALQDFHRVTYTRCQQDMSEERHRSLRRRLDREGRRCRPDTLPLLEHTTRHG